MMKPVAQIGNGEVDGNKINAWALHNRNPDNARHIDRSPNRSYHKKDAYDTLNYDPSFSSFATDSMRSSTSILRPLSRRLDYIKERGQLLVKTVAGVFEKVDGERSRCPRCKGSGLLTMKSWWNFTSQETKDDPCWFCLGIGVMPILDLQGFLIARSTPVFKTTDIPSYRPPKIHLNLCLGKYPDSRCRLITSRLSKETKVKLFSAHQNSILSVANDDGDGSLYSRAKLTSFNDHISNPVSSIGMNRSMQSFNDRGNRHHSYKGPRNATYDEAHQINPSSPESSPTFNSIPPTTDSSYIGGSPIGGISPISHSFSERPSSPPRGRTASQPVDLEANVSTVRGRSSSPVRSNNRRYFNQGHPVNSPPSSPPPSPNRMGRRWNDTFDPRDGSVYMQQPSSPSSHPESPRSRSPRRERNRIREKAEREAMERARRLQRPSSPRASERFKDHQISSALDQTLDISMNSWSDDQVNILNKEENAKIFKKSLQGNVEVARGFPFSNPSSKVLFPESKF